MSQSEKAAYYKALKAAEVEFTKHYRQYTTEELKAAHDRLVEAGVLPALQIPAEDPRQPGPEDVPLPGMGEHLLQGPDTGDEPANFNGPVEQMLNEEPVPDASFFGLRAPDRPAPPVRAKDPNEVAGQRQNSQPVDEPIRVDPETGRIWYQEEILKPAFPKARTRRVLQVQDPGVRTETIKRGDYVESFEVPGNEVGRTSEIKITLPAYQVGIYRDPRFPFKVHTYNGEEGFDLFEVQDYFGGAELVPSGVKRKYVSNVLCYDIRTVVRAIEDEYRRLQLAGKV